MHHLGHALLSLSGHLALTAAFRCGNHYDAVIIGGGASDTYTAVRIKVEGKRVSLIEREDHLGGQVNTYIDLTTQQPFDHGVLIYENISVLRTFFDSVKAPYKSAGPFLPGMKDAYVDFASKQAVLPAQAAAISGNATEQTTIYIEQLKRFPYLSEAGCHLPDPVLEELIIPFGDWLEKYNIKGLAAGLFNFDYAGISLLSLRCIC
ncbi:hypothetical protein M409DRAFT_53004 [Zasmidium cellare ATCC 36951]|uniref:Amine oxidase domain-containing protein n=1 Tax=Zasmidium cellare ATCC 36951 TaxID=1080233 RepID=A0A6A6CS76_ZASCE|nr:uncharacterized protein M409DRAFT_53004 [Zasmidium cellare ATCC 36951]KAF2169038.1 hypothetical protein M409DRAFT_53004 [Zasmidium cellare ATCC 36951]